ncbi:hypothetical protein F4802DRAFT_238443 [Xylaria palmicola]|nr:hypothetical protein F4802DRAFT_238443 [Xylaria palmicola]
MLLLEWRGRSLFKHPVLLIGAEPDAWRCARASFQAARKPSRGSVAAGSSLCGGGLRNFTEFAPDAGACATWKALRTAGDLEPRHAVRESAGAASSFGNTKVCTQHGPSHGTQLQPGQDEAILPLPAIETPKLDSRGKCVPFSWHIKFPKGPIISGQVTCLRRPVGEPSPVRYKQYTRWELLCHRRNQRPESAPLPLSPRGGI